MTQMLTKKAELFILKPEIHCIMEAMGKKSRPYYFSVDLENGFSAVIPSRSSFSHPYGFITKKVKEHGLARSSVLDFTKSLLFQTSSLDSLKLRKVAIDRQEYKKINQNQTRIKDMFIEYVDEYRRAYVLNRDGALITNKHKLLLEYSTLKNYHTIIGVES